MEQHQLFISMNQLLPNLGPKSSHLETSSLAQPPTPYRILYTASGTWQCLKYAFMLDANQANLKCLAKTLRQYNAANERQCSLHASSLSIFTRAVEDM